LLKLVKILPLLIQPIPPRRVVIINFEHYLISYWGGLLFNTRTGQPVKGWLNAQRYRRAKLRNNGKVTLQYIHRLVAMTWIPNPDNKEEVNHLDKIRDSNSVPNLNWVTHAENMAYIKCELHVEIIEEVPF